MLPILMAGLLLLPLSSPRHYENSDLLADKTFVICVGGEIVHSPLTGDSYRVNPAGRLERLKRSRLPCPLSSVMYLGEHLLISKPPWSRQWVCWYHFPADTGWVPVDYVPPAYFVPNWQAWRADQERVDREVSNMLRARDEYSLMWEER
jgi:hypothetical protein